MPFIIRNRHDRAAVQLAHASALRSTNEVVEQLQAQIRELQAQLQREHEQHAFTCNEFEKQIADLLRDCMQAKYQLAKKEFKAAPSPCTMAH